MMGRGDERVASHPQVRRDLPIDVHPLLGGAVPFEEAHGLQDLLRAPARDPAPRGGHRRMAPHHGLYRLYGRHLHLLHRASKM